MNVPYYLSSGGAFSRTRFSVLPHIFRTLASAPASLHSAIISLLLVTTAVCQQMQQSSPQDLRSVQQRLEDTHWKFVDVRDSIQSGGATVTKDGAWLAIRLRGAGLYSAWHGEKILHESKWDVVDATTIRLHDCGPDRATGLLVSFNSALTAFKCSNDSACSGSFVAKLSKPDSLVGRWHWHGTDVVRFREDGMGIDERTYSNSIKWRPSGKDRYEVQWNNGQYVDRVRMKSGNKELTCENQHGDKFGAQRVGTK